MQNGDSAHQKQKCSSDKISLWHLPSKKWEAEMFLAEHLLQDLAITQKYIVQSYVSQVG